VGGCFALLTISTAQNFTGDKCDAAYDAGCESSIALHAARFGLVFTTRTQRNEHDGCNQTENYRQSKQTNVQFH